MSTHKEIGSFFPAPSDDILLSKRASPPWVDVYGHTMYVQTGRQALRLIAKHLRDEEVNCVVLPAHYCDSMVLPFLEEGIHAKTYPLDSDLRPDTERLLEAVLAGGSTTAVVSVAYFGRSHSADLKRALQKLSNVGYQIIEDETHRPFKPGSPYAAYSFASLRKTLPVADGAYIRSKNGLIPEYAENAAKADPIWDAMDRLQAASNVNDARSIREEIRRATMMIESSSDVAAVSERTEMVLNTLDYEEISLRRVANGLCLEDKLTRLGIEVLSGSGDHTVPSHTVVSVRDAKAVQKSLALQGIYCPIHWPESKVLRTESTWRTDLLSLPIDHRYSQKDMKFVATEVQKVVSS